jgi:hypothetical protein
VHATTVAPTAVPPQPMDLPLARPAVPSLASSVRQQADDVSNVIQFDNLRRDMCTDIRLKKPDKDTVLLQLDELYALSLTSAVMVQEPGSAALIANMKRWVVTSRARPTHMAMCGDDVILTFIAKKLMEQDERMASDILVDAQFADFLSQNNKIRKSLASTNALSGGGGHVPHQVKQPPAVLICPKCYGDHRLRFCPSPVATLSLGGPQNHAWREEGPRTDRSHKGGGGGGFPRRGQPAIMP